MPSFPKNDYFLPPDMHTYICVWGGKKCSFFGIFGVLCFLETPVLRFALLPYYRRIRKISFSQNPQKLSMEKLIWSEVPGIQSQQLFPRYFSDIILSLSRRITIPEKHLERCQSLFPCIKYERKPELNYFFCSVHLAFHFTR